MSRVLELGQSDHRGWECEVWVVVVMSAGIVVLAVCWRVIHKYTTGTVLKWCDSGFLNWSRCCRSEFLATKDSAVRQNCCFTITLIFYGGQLGEKNSLSSWIYHIIASYIREAFTWLDIQPVSLLLSLTLSLFDLIHELSEFYRPVCPLSSSVVYLLAVLKYTV